MVSTFGRESLKWWSRTLNWCLGAFQNISSELLSFLFIWPKKVSSAPPPLLPTTEFSPSLAAGQPLPYISAIPPLFRRGDRPLYIKPGERWSKYEEEEKFSPIFFHIKNTQQLHLLSFANFFIRMLIRIPIYAFICIMFLGLWYLLGWRVCWSTSQNQANT